MEEVPMVPNCISRAHVLPGRARIARIFPRFVSGVINTDLMRPSAASNLVGRTTRRRPAAHLVAGVAVLLGLSLSAAALGDDGVDAYVMMAGASDQELPEHAMAGRGFEVRNNPQAMSHAQITFQLPDGRALLAERKRMVANAGGRSWVGQFEGVTGGIVVLSHRNGIVTGVIDDGENLYELLPGRSGQSLLFQVDESKLPATAEPVPMPDTDTSASGATGPAGMAEAGHIQDIMLLYTPAVRASYGGAAIAAAALQDAVIATNQAYLDSLVDVQLNVVHVAEVSYTETNDIYVTLTRLRSGSDGYMDEVHAWRDTHAADLVALISMDADGCGIGYLMTSDSSGFASSAFSVTRKSCLSNLSLMHEIGHNQGNCHNREETGCTNPAYAFGYGYCGAGFRTIMSYSSPCGRSRIRQFSNPTVSVNGEPTGIDHDLDPNNSADAARSMNNTAATVASFRSGAATLPMAPGNLAAGAVSDSQINLQWSDNSVDESGFELQRSSDGSNWSALASLGANSVAYSDTGLPASTTYFYRVRAFNSAGSSGWSNTDSAQTLAPPPPPPAPGPLTATAVSGAQVDLAWADVTDETGYRVERSTDGTSFTLITNTSADQIGHSDRGLAPATSYYYRVTAFNGGGDSPFASASAQTLSYVVYTPVDETTTFGNVTGSYADASYDDGIAERIAEMESGGKKNQRHTRLQHRWQFNLVSGTSAMLAVNAWKTGTSEDDFVFEYSIDGASYSPLFTLMSADPDNQQMALLPADVGGALYIQVTDTDRTAGNRNLESIHVDHMYIRVDGGAAGDPPIAPVSLTADARVASAVDLSWADLSDNEFGFEVECSIDGSSWQRIATTAANASSYTDTTVVGDQLYFYRVNAFNAAGASAWDGPVTVQTPTGVVLNANAYKVKGIKHVDLSWTGSTEKSWDIYRQGTLIDTVPIGASTTHTDNTGARGGGSILYQVCETGNSSLCSNEVNATF
jgi:hypothetical protein